MINPAERHEPAAPHAIVDERIPAPTGADLRLDALAAMTDDDVFDLAFFVATAYPQIHSEAMGWVGRHKAQMEATLRSALADEAEQS